MLIIFQILGIVGDICNKSEIRTKFHATSINVGALQYRCIFFEIFSMEALQLPHEIVEHQMHTMNFLNELYLDL